MSYNTGYWDMVALQSGDSTFPRRTIAQSTVSTGNGNLRLTYFVSRIGETVTQVRTLSGTTAAVGTTLAKVGVYSEDASGNLTLIGATANTTTLWATINTAYTTSLSSSFAKTRGVRYAVGTLVVGTTTSPTLQGITAPTVPVETSQQPRMSGLISGQTDLPSSITAASLLDNNTQHYAVLLP
jgi:hypothetical protein